MNPETIIQKHILCAISAYKEVCGFEVFRMNNGAVWNKHANAYQATGPWHPHGLADIMVLAPGGRVVWLEVKTATGTQSDDQITWQAMCERLGMLYAVVRSADEARAVLCKAGIIYDTLSVNT